MRVLGIDPGLVRTGWAVVEPASRSVAVVAHGLIAPTTSDDLPARLASGARQLRLVVEEYAPQLAALEEVFTTVTSDNVHLCTTTTDPEIAQDWFTRFEGAGLDGVMAKPLDAPYVPDKRTMLKIKHSRTADVVVAGYREHKTSTPEKPLLGSLLLGLYAPGEDGQPELQHIGVSASFTAARRAELWQELQPLVVPIEDHPWGRWQEFLTANPDRVPGTQSRWSQGKDLSFTPLRPERVLEVGYDHMEGRRFRHTAQFKRWRPDRDPESCGYEQLEEPVAYELSEVLGGASKSR